MELANADVTRFDSVDQSGDPAFYQRFLDAGNRLLTAAGGGWKPAMLERLGPGPGARVLDVGCGLGDDAFALAAQVKPLAASPASTLADF